ncbi:MAG: hypothetical protein ACE5HN_04955 [Nitrospiria bacterium]
MRKPIILLFLFLVMSGCGDDLAPLDAVVTGPEDSTFTVAKGSPGETFLFTLDFQVKNLAGDALPEVEIEFIASGGTLTDLDGNVLNLVDPFFFKTLTDDRGLGRVSFLTTLPACSATADQTVTGLVTASVGVDNDQWEGTFTVPTC